MRAEHLPLQQSCKVIKCHPEGLWAIEKSSGVLSHPNSSSASTRSVLQCCFDFKKECYKWQDEAGENHQLFLTHRIDSATSGVMIAASCPELASNLKKSFADREVEKTYFAIVQYNRKPINGTWKDYLVKKVIGGKLRVSTGRQGAVAITIPQIKRKTNSLALLKLMPQTGRTHQLRIQCAKRGFGIIGDRTYGNFELNRTLAKIVKSDRLFLHASKIKVNVLLNDKRTINWEAESPIPPIFNQLLETG